MSRWNTPPHRYTAAEIRFLEKKVAGRSYAELTDLFNRRFGLDFTVKRLNGAAKRFGLTNGRDCRFRPGLVPHNKGKTGCCPAGCEKGWFKPGHRPQRQKPVRTERVSKDGYIEVRIRNPSGKKWKNWKAKHRIIWEKAYGKIPRGHIVIFADGDKRNFALENLLLVSRREHAVMNRCNLRSPHGGLTRTGKAVADLKIQIADLRRKIGKKKRKKATGRVKGETR
jgi:hypothetical protein